MSQQSIVRKQNPIANNKSNLISEKMPKSSLSYLNNCNLSFNSIRNYKSALKGFDHLYESNHLNMKYLSKEHFDMYKGSLENIVNNGQIKIITARKKLGIIKKFSRYLFNNNLINFIYRESLIINSVIPETPLPNIIKPFLDELTVQNYSQIYTYKKNIMYFIKFLSKTTKDFPNPELLKESEIKKFNKGHIDSYHKFLARRIELNEITKSRALNLLRCLKLFIQFNRRLKLIEFKYSIPDKFQIQHSRNNEFVPSLETLKLINAIIDYSRQPERDLSIFLIILDTGCRPIEIINMKCNDIFISESAILLRCKKSGQRKLTLNKKVMDVLKSYLKIRINIEIKEEPLFLTRDNQPLSINIIGGIYGSANKKVYEKIKFTAKSYRHTYITNGLENNNGLDKMSKAVGHKHWISTQYYLEKSIERLKRNTLIYNPLKDL